MIDSNKQTQETFHQDGPIADLRVDSYVVQEEFCNKLSSITEAFYGHFDKHQRLCSYNVLYGH